MSGAAAFVLACASGRPARAEPSAAADPPRRVPAGQWPESWGAEFGLRCAAAGEDVRVCTCVANEIQKRWTPEQFRALGPEALHERVRACRERIAAEAK